MSDIEVDLSQYHQDLSWVTHATDAANVYAKTVEMNAKLVSGPRADVVAAARAIVHAMHDTNYTQLVGIGSPSLNAFFGELASMSGYAHRILEELNETP